MSLKSWQQTRIDSEVRDETKRKGDQKDSADDEEWLDSWMQASSSCRTLRAARTPEH